MPIMSLMSLFVALQIRRECILLCRPLLADVSTTLTVLLLWGAAVVFPGKQIGQTVP